MPAVPNFVAADVTEVVMPGLVEPDGLQVRTRPMARPVAGQALIEIEASGVSFAEQAMRRGRYPGQPKFPFVTGYDLVGTVVGVGASVDPALIGRRVAAITETRGWASHALVSADELVPVPDGLDPTEVEAVVVNGVTAWQMLHRKARLRPGQTILVHGANGGVGTILVQLAYHHGVRVIGAASPRHHDALRALGVVPVDYHDPDLMASRIRDIAPGGVDAVFDNIGGETINRSWDLLSPGGTLVSYSIASVIQGTGSILVPYMFLLARLAWWNALPNWRKATFYDVWDRNLIGRIRRPAEFRVRLREDLTTIFGLLAQGVITSQVAARFPLANVREAMEFAESRTAIGKVIIVPDPQPAADSAPRPS